VKYVEEQWRASYRAQDNDPEPWRLEGLALFSCLTHRASVRALLGNRVMRKFPLRSSAGPSTNSCKFFVQECLGLLFTVRHHLLEESWVAVQLRSARSNAEAARGVLLDQLVGAKENRPRGGASSIHRVADKVPSRKPAFSRSHPYGIGPARSPYRAGRIEVVPTQRTGAMRELPPYIVLRNSLLQDTRTTSLA
jgi:hypothetical protein